MVYLLVCLELGGGWQGGYRQFRWLNRKNGLGKAPARGFRKRSPLKFLQFQFSTTPGANAPPLLI
jgi:hypothetical protein